MLLVYGIAFAQMVLFVMTTYVIARAFGVAPRVIGFGAPAVLRVRKASPEIRIGPLPTASVQLAGERVEQGQRVKYADLSRTKRVAIVLAPWVLMLGIAMACIGAEPAIRAFMRGFSQLIVTPDLTPLVRKMIAIANTAPVGVSVGIMLAKLCAMNLVPFGGAAGGCLFLEMATPAKREAPPIVMRYMMASMLVWMLWTLGRAIYVVVQLAR